MHRIRKVGIIGAGLMGGGIASVCALAGYDVFLADISPDHLRRGIENIEKMFSQDVEKKRLTEKEQTTALARIVPAGGIVALSHCELIIEAIVEEEGAKRKVISELSQIIAPQAILASNTSSLSISKLASLSTQPERFIGIHFMNPVPRMKLVELIRGLETDDATFETASSFVSSLGKTPILSGDYPAFTVNRILLPMINEAIYVLYEGISSKEAIDSAMKLGTNHPMGPLQLADTIGLDTCLSIMKILHKGFADSKYRPCPLLVKYVEAGWLGRKTGRGFYDYRSPPLPG